MIKLTEQQQAIVEHDEGPALVYAVAGAGKTTTMVHRIERLVREGVFEPRRMLATTFNRAAATEIRTKLRCWRHCEPVKATTLHAFGYSIIRQAVRRRYLRPVRVLDQPDKLLYEALRLLRRKDVWFKDELDQLDKDDFLTYVSACKGNLEYADLSAANLPLSGLKLASQAVAPTTFLSWYVDLYRIFEQVRIKANWITFDDMLLQGWEVLIKHPDVLSYVRNLFHCVLVDEFQDINFAQSEILDLIVAEHLNYMAIGDDDQTIYEWRGANPKFILNFEARYEAKKYLISDNFRSPASQIALANEVIQHNKKRENKFLSLTQGFNGRVFLHSEANEEKMARHLVEQIELALKDGLQPEELVILIRIYAQTPYIEQFMIEKRIPYLIVGSVPFYRRTEVVTLLNYCHVAMIDKKLQAGQELTVKDIETFTKAWRNIYNRPKRYLSRVISDKIRDTMLFHQLPFERALAVMGSDINFWLEEKLFKFLRTLDWLSRHLDMPATKLLDKLEKRLDYKHYLEESSGFPETGQAKAATVDAFIQYAKGKGNILEFIDHLQDISFGQLHTVREHGNDDSRFVKIMTIFRAKGLEWDTVFVPHCNRGTIPFGKDKRRLEEERRLLYVAMTRSRKYLHLYWTSPISPFLVEANLEKTLDEVLRLQKILTSAPNEWQRQELPLVANGIERFRLKRFFSEWWQIPAERKQEIAKLMLASYNEKDEALEEQADKSLSPNEVKFWERFSGDNHD
jgi:DNA helicase-2/ATP-dependent DNA helicase PcrA